MPRENAWEGFFNAHAPIYNDNCFTKNTVAEADFLVEELGLPAGAAILDVGCGTGRHSVELAKRGFAMTGLDLSAAMLAEAEKAAQAAGVQVEWIRADAANFSLPDKFDAAICLCEGAFGLLGQQDDPIEQPLAILRNISASLRPGAKAIFTVLNAMHMIRKHQYGDVAAGRFDPLTLVESSEMAPSEGLPPVPTRERGFVPTELALIFRMAGMDTLHLWGGTAGNWGRRPLDLDEMEIMAVAWKPGESLA